MENFIELSIEEIVALKEAAELRNEIYNLVQDGYSLREVDELIHEPVCADYDDEIIY